MALAAAAVVQSFLMAARDAQRAAARAASAHLTLREQAARSAKAWGFTR